MGCQAGEANNQTYQETAPRAQQETSLVDATSQLPTTNTLPAAPLPPKGVKQKKSYLSPGKEQATSPGSTRSAESLGPLILDDNIIDNDSIAAVAEIPDLIDLSPGIAVVTDITDNLNQPSQAPSLNRQRTDRSHFETTVPTQQPIRHFETPSPTRRLVEWARQTDNAMYKAEEDNTPTHTDTTQQPATLEAAMMGFARCLIGPLTDIATGVKSIDQDTKLPAEGNVQMDEGEADVHEILIAQPEGGGCISTAIRLHCAALMQRVQGGPLPAPAPDVERAQWIHTFENQANTGGSDTNIKDKTQADDMDLDTHPRLVLYHQNLTPDLGTAPSKPSNDFLWDLALKIFMIIVRAGEYPTVTESFCNEAQAKKHLRIHVDTCEWRKQTKMTPEAIAATQKRVRRNTQHGRLCEWRTDTILTIPAINQLVPIVAQYCSDDETNDELDEEGHESLAPGQKACVVLGMP
ncbi:hypothetical protein PSTG_03750 [Puccinia striiformis f. sp. tritici PST-78]|uniref:Uncharacterized protein n=1 Tax=Puccinia striiformis f. sp. tritici PST-78 TaxID=1165861 RepID=A0A0L0VV59_9BASI|nr:hypothetical protein PSTG_03750 [Puccinia striiformis f. sp. tritici PST-78]